MEIQTYLSYTWHLKNDVSIQTIIAWCNLILKFVHPSKTAEVRGELERSNNRDLVSFDLSINDENVFGYNYDCKHSADNRDSSMKVRLPSRSIMVTNQVQNRSKRTECLGKKGFTVHGNTNVPVLYLASQERC
jgi:hypothetical protein